MFRNTRFCDLRNSCCDHVESFRTCFIGGGVYLLFTHMSSSYSLSEETPAENDTCGVNVCLSLFCPFELTLLLLFFCLLVCVDVPLLFCLYSPVCMRG